MSATIRCHDHSRDPHDREARAALGWARRRNCPIARMFDAIGTKSAFVILREAFYGATRFEEFVERTGHERAGGLRHGCAS